MTCLRPPRPLQRGLCTAAGVALGVFGCASAPPARGAASAEPASMLAEPPPAEPTAVLAPAPPRPPSEGPRDARGKEEILAVITANREKVRACYDAAREKNPDIHGDLMVGFVINPDGSVKSAEINASESELHVPELDACALDVLRTLKFPASTRGLESRVNYPFNFKPRPPPTEN